MKGSKVNGQKVFRADNGGEEGYTIPETVAALAITAVIAVTCSGILDISLRAAASVKNTVTREIAWINFDRALRKTAGNIVVPYWEPGTNAAWLDKTGNAGNGKTAVPWYCGSGGRSLILYLDDDHLFVAEESGENGTELLLSSPQNIKIDRFEIVTGAEEPGIRISRTVSEKTVYIHAAFGGFPPVTDAGQ